VFDRLDRPRYNSQVTPRSWRSAVVVAALMFVFAVAGSAQRRDAFVQSRNHPAIAYATAPVDDAVSRLNKRLANGSAKLTFNDENGYLRSVLEALDIPIESQSLVFSQTSFQTELIGVRNPRAIYFNDTTAVGWVRGADLLEVAAQDPREGVIFYELNQKQIKAPVLKRDDDCLACHLSWDTLGVPGLMVQSVHPLADLKSYVIGFTTNHASNFTDRWGGWYVTGTHGKLHHIGNVPVMPQDKGKLTLADPREIESVKGLFDLKGYATPYSDVTALMVYDHQTFMTNQITHVSWEARLADAAPSTDAAERVRDAANDLVDYMLFIDEVPLPHPMAGASGFAAKFSAQGPRDRQGRSLHELDLQRHLLRYPCSYMIYSPGFEGMPATAKRAVYARMSQILSGKETKNRYTARLSRADREAVLQILRDTKKDLPAGFGA
jgi:hypothetical protein